MIKTNSKRESNQHLLNLNKIFRGSPIKEREIYFIYFLFFSFIVGNNNVNCYLNTNIVGLPLMDKELDKSIGDYQRNTGIDFIGYAQDSLNFSLLPDIAFRSIDEKSIRMTRYILFNISNNQTILQAFQAENGINYFLRSKISTDIGKIIFSIDTIFLVVQEKEKIVSAALNGWSNHIKDFKKDYDWFLDEKYKVSRVEFALDWIQKKMNYQSAVFSEHCLPDETTKLMLILDEIFYLNLIANNICNLRLQLGELKKYWSQYNYRESLKNGKKKQCNIILSNRAVSELDELSEKYVMSRAKIIEKLIRKEIGCGIYLDEK